MIDAFKRASAWRVTAVVPYYAYARQDRKDKPRVPISAKLVADLLETAGANRALTLDLHAPQIQGYFNVPVDHLYASPVLVEYFKQQEAEESHGGFAGCGRRGARAGLREEAGCAAGHRGQAARGRGRQRSDAPDRRRARRAGADHRRHYRYGGNAGEDGRGAAEGRRDAKCYAACTHPVLSGPAVERICANRRSRKWWSRIRCRCREAAQKVAKIKVLSVAELLARGIRSIHEETSISELFV